MALKSCRECKSSVSDKAKTCPSCGISNPIKKGTTWPVIALGLIVIFIILSPKNENLTTTAPIQQTNNVEKNSPPSTHSKIDTKLNVQVIGGNRIPEILVESNLPENTVISATLANPINKGGTGYFGQSTSPLSKTKSTKIGPFSDDGNPLTPGSYMVTVSVSSMAQPQSVQSLIGFNGEHLEGDNIFKLGDLPGRMIWQRYVFELQADGSITNFEKTANSEADSSLIPIE